MGRQRRYSRLRYSSYSEVSYVLSIFDTITRNYGRIFNYHKGTFSKEKANWPNPTCAVTQCELRKLPKMPMHHTPSSNVGAALKTRSTATIVLGNQSRKRSLPFWSYVQSELRCFLQPQIIRTKLFTGNGHYGSFYSQSSLFQEPLSPCGSCQASNYAEYQNKQKSPIRLVLGGQEDRSLDF